MADLHEAVNLLPQIDSESAEFSLALKHLNQRISDLSVFEQAIYGRAPIITTSPEALEPDEDLHKRIDLFTHYKSCSHRRRMSKFDRGWQAPQACKACYNSSATMDFESWQPNDHHITIQRFPAMAKKEARAWHMIQMGPAESDGARGRVKKVSRKRHRAHMSSEADTENGSLPSPVPRPRFLRGSGAHRRVSARETPCEADVSTNDEEHEVYGFGRGSSDVFREDKDGTIKWNESNDTGMDILSADMAYEDDLFDHEESYKESSSQVKAWYMHPERMGSTP